LNGSAAPGYRADVDGLRAIAILAVVAFHAFPSLLPGGFVGVDVFFVVSGFLITRLIAAGIEQRRFSFAGFYRRRIGRLFPALALVLATSLAYAWFFLPPADFGALGRHVAAGAGFVANLVYWSDSGYFAPSASGLHLLHLWSLGIEEQFYIAWPLLVVLALRARMMPARTVVLLLGAASFALNLWQTGVDPTGAFYSPLTRCWQLAAGAWLAFGAEATSVAEKAGNAHWRHEVRPVAGALLIAASALFLGPSSAYPGWLALMPTLGALLLLDAPAGSWIRRVALAHPALVLLGLISYPLYLWHWPLLVALDVASALPGTEAIRVAAVAASVVLAALTWRFVERPLQAHRGRPVVAAYLCSAMLAIGIAGYAVFATNGFPHRFADQQEFSLYFDNHPPRYRYSRAANIEKVFREECDFYRDNRVNERIAEDCHVPLTNRRVFLWGDSHAKHLSPGLRAALPPDVSLLQVASSACYPESGPPRRDLYGACARSNQFALERIAATRPDVVVIAQVDGHLATDFVQLARHLRSLGAGHVLVAGPVPQWSYELHRMVLKEYWTRTPRRLKEGLRAKPFEADRELKRRLGGLAEPVYLSLVDALCNADGCIVYLGEDRMTGLVTADYAHLTPRASEYVGRERLGPAVLRLLRR